MELSLSEVERAAEACLLPIVGSEARNEDALRQLPIKGWSIDSRTLEPGDLFIALAGEHFDGHNFVGSALTSGAVAALVNRGFRTGSGPLLETQDTLKALQQLAHWVRRRWNRPVVAITGSAGKTSTKEITASLLATRFRVGKTIGNYNNHIGLPLTLLRLPADSEVAVVEMGMNHGGEIRELARIAEPEVGVVTNVGYAHIEAFESIEGIAAAKRELIEGLKPGGTAVLNADDARVARFADIHPGRTLTYGLTPDADLSARDLASGPADSSFTVCNTRFKTKLTGRHAVSNILAALAVAKLFDIPLSDLVEPVRDLATGKMRGERIERNGVTILNDAYNSNPEAARSMLDVLRAEPAERRIAVLGEMLELGGWSERLHSELGKYAMAAGVDVLIGVGGASRLIVDEAKRAGLNERAGFFFEEPENAGEFLRDFVKPGDAILFKGSRGVHVEKALARMDS